MELQERAVTFGSQKTYLAPSASPLACGARESTHAMRYLVDPFIFLSFHNLKMYYCVIWMYLYTHMRDGQRTFGWQFSSHCEFQSSTQVARLVATQILYKPWIICFLKDSLKCWHRIKQTHFNSLLLSLIRKPTKNYYVSHTPFIYFPLSNLK